MNDIRFAFRQLRKSPGFTFVAVLTLALAIGANGAIFSVINAVLLRPVPYPGANRIVTLHETAAGQGQVAIAFPDAQDFRRDNKVFEHLAISRFDGDSLSGIAGRAAEHIGVAYVTAGFFKVIGLAPKIGRAFNEDEDRAGAAAVVVISEALWQRAFAGDAAVLGRAIRLHDRPYTVIGVMPAALTSPEGADAWVPIMPRASNGIWQSRAIHPMIFGWGRLKPGVSIEQARHEMTAIAARIEKHFPETNKGVGASVTSMIDSLVGDYRKNLTLLLGAVGLVLLIACANLANLFAARGAARAREFAIRAAVGASRRRLVRQLLIESAVVALLGGALGFLLAMWSRDALVALAPAGVERFREIAFDGGVLGFTFGIASLTSVLFGLWPAWTGSRTNLQLALHTGSSRTSESRAAGKTRDWLVIAEIALTLVLLSSAGIVLKSFARTQALALGYQPRDLLTARIDLPFTKYRDVQQVTNFANGLLEKVGALPGVQNAALGSNPPLIGQWQISFLREGQAADPSDQPSADSEIVAGDYFNTIGATLLRGRTFNDRDNKNSPLVTVIDQTLAEQYFHGEDPIGKRLSMHPDDVGDENRFYEIVGVVARMKFRGLGDPAPLPVVFFPQAQVERKSFVLLVRSTATALEKPIRDIVSSIDPDQPVYDVRPMMDRVQETWATQRLLTFLLSVFAGLALLLATLGLYGVIAYTAVRRVREIGVRLALGAQRADIRALILSHGSRLLATGLTIGVVGAFACSRLLRSVLFDVSAVDPVIYVAVSVLLAVAALLACWLPARRASRLNPIIALRAE
jgi:putative ABC transport system permease protein